MRLFILGNADKEGGIYSENSDTSSIKIPDTKKYVLPGTGAFLRKSEFIQSTEKLFRKIAQYHWWGIGFIVLLLVGLEAFEFLTGNSATFHAGEAIVYFVFLVIIGFQIELLSRYLNFKEHTLKILSAKHKLAQDLTEVKNWETLTAQVVKVPSAVADVDASCLFVKNSLTNTLQLEATWSNSDNDISAFCASEKCNRCVGENKDNAMFKHCSQQAQVNPLDQGSSDGEYCLPIVFGKNLLALVKFRLRSGYQLTLEQEEIFKNIGNEIALSLAAGLERKKHSELSIAQATLTERRSISHLLHDSLGQNLGYLRLKIDQLLNEMEQLPHEIVQADLEQMLDSANRSYEIVRNHLEEMEPETTPRLTNLLQQYAKQIGQRSNLEIHFLSQGNPSALTSEIQKSAFYVFGEVLSNIEKHSKATRVDITTEWCNSALSIVVSDNGIGFEPDLVDSSKHFGLEIMRERIAEAKGKVELETASDSGTTVKIVIPILPIDSQRLTINDAIHFS